MELPFKTSTTPDKPEPETVKGLGAKVGRWALMATVSLVAMAAVRVAVKHSKTPESHASYTMRHNESPASIHAKRIVRVIKGQMAEMNAESELVGWKINDIFRTGATITVQGEIDGPLAAAPDLAFMCEMLAPFLAQKVRFNYEYHNTSGKLLKVVSVNSYACR